MLNIVYGIQGKTSGWDPFWIDNNFQMNLNKNWVIMFQVYSTVWSDDWSEWDFLTPARKPL